MGYGFHRRRQPCQARRRAAEQLLRDLGRFTLRQQCATTTSPPATPPRRPARWNLVNLPPFPILALTRLPPCPRAPPRPSPTTYFVLLPLLRTTARTLPQYSPHCSSNQRALLSRGATTASGTTPRGGRCPGCWRCWPEHGIADVDGDIWLQTWTCAYGAAPSKPVSFWYCFRAQATGGALRAVVAEVNNTFGERHCCIARAPPWGQRWWRTRPSTSAPSCRRRPLRFCFTARSRGGIPPECACVDHHDAKAAHPHPHPG